ncbi:MAG: exo-alpha-sialidase [Chthoniobacterales bacterium]|nr:exo-alpha-sialidase [Chthoniobacterales bacterium]
MGSFRSARARFALALWLFHTFFVAAHFSAAPASQPAQGTASEWNPSYDRANWPAAVRDVPLDRLSTGALLRLDRDGDLVEPPSSVAARQQAFAESSTRTEAVVALDPRVGSNIRLGDDPAALPSDQRAQAEPHIARAPSAPDFLLATFQEGRYTNGGAIDCGYSVSRNGGLTWTRALIPQLTPASGGPYPRATDPVAAIDLNGTAYLNTLGFDGGFGAVVVSRSTDGGQTFAPPVVAYQSASSAVFPDKNWIAVNDFAPNVGRLAVTFTLFSNTQGIRPSPIMRVLSDDGGQTWTSPASIHPSNYEVQGSQPVFLPNNRLAIVYWNFNFTDRSTDDFLECVVSNDGGVTFGPPKFITSVHRYNPTSIRSGAFLPSATTDRTTGNLYVVYQEFHDPAAGPRVVFTKSTDGGNTWSRPIPASDNPGSTHVFNPAIATSPDGQTLTVSYYTNRDNPTSNTLVDMYLAQSFDGGATWRQNIRVSNTSTNAALAPNTGSSTQPAYMLGDYLGIAGAANVHVPAVPVWVDTRTGNPDPFVARVGIAPAVDFTSWEAARLSLAQINNPALGGQAGDADNDGEDNLSEFRSGTNPLDPLSVFRSARQLNISTRAFVQTGDNVLIGGFIVTGSDSKKVILRALGPSLTSRGVAGAMQDPILTLAGSNGVPIITNDDWRQPDGANIAATGLQPADDRESAIVQTLPPGSYTAVVRGKNNSTGVALVEAYDLNPMSNSRLANISSRGLAATGENVIIGGIIIGAGRGVDGGGSARVVLRGLGPSLAQSGVSNALQNPELQLVDGNGSTVAFNDDWRQTQQAELQATGIPPNDDRESAIVVTLRKGDYTAIVRGKGGTTGVALVESYDLQ